MIKKGDEFLQVTRTIMNANPLFRSQKP